MSAFEVKLAVFTITAMPVVAVASMMLGYSFG